MFVLKTVVPEEITLGDIAAGSLPYVLVLLVGMALVMIFPDLALWLPRLAG